MYFNKYARIFNVKQNESVKYILMSFDMLPANILVLQKKLMLSTKLMLYFDVFQYAACKFPSPTKETNVEC